MEFKSLDQQRREIRLLRINGTSALSKRDDAQYDTPLQLDLEHKPRDETKYIALSYVWGDANNPVEVIINGASVPLHYNLWEALCQLRRQHVSSWLWIDAICINQDDEAEKSWLVNDMRYIFERAQIVYHWLGPASDDSDFAMDQLAQLGRDAFEAGILTFTALPLIDLEVGIFRFIQEKRPGLLSPSDITPPSLRDMIVEKLLSGTVEESVSNSMAKAATFLAGLAICDPCDLDSTRMTAALAALLSREFWSRLWIIQELGLARIGVLLCGDRLLPVNQFESALAVDRTAMFSLLRHRLGKRAILWSINRNLLSPGGLEVRKQSRQGKPPTLLSILLSGIGFAGRPQYAASDPRDIIFGLLGVISDVDELNIYADYGATAAETFTAVTRAYLPQSMKLLGYCGTEKDLKDLPSWVPDWSRIGREGLDIWPIAYGRDFKSSLGHCQPERAWAEQRKPGLLSLSGVRLGKVASVQPAGNQGPNGAPSFVEIIGYCDDNKIRDMGLIIRTCLMDTSWISAHVDVQIDSVFIGLAEKVFRGEKGIDECKCSPEEVELLSRYRSVSEMDSPLGHPASTETDFESFTRSIQGQVRHWLSRYRLFATDDGKLGLGGRRVAVGDLVTIIFGYEAPMVIHPINDRWFSVVSDAYVDGVMYGEVMEERIGDTDVFEIA